MSDCKHENSNYHYYMEEVCECGYKRVMDEDEAEDKVVTTIVYSKDKVQNCLIRQNEQLTIDLQAEKARADELSKKNGQLEARVAELENSRHVSTEIVKIIEHGIKGKRDSVRSYAELLAQKCDENSKRRIKIALGDIKTAGTVTLDGDSHCAKGDWR